MVKLVNTTNLSFVDFGLEGSSPFLDIRGYNSIGRMLTLHVKSLGSIPSFSKLVKLNWLSEILKLFRL